MSDVSGQIQQVTVNTSQRIPFSELYPAEWFKFENERRKNVRNAMLQNHNEYVLCYENFVVALFPIVSSGSIPTYPAAPPCAGLCL